MRNNVPRITSPLELTTLTEKEAHERNVASAHHGRDQATINCLGNLEDFCCPLRRHTIMNCVDVCPKGLNPSLATGKKRAM